MNNEKERKRYDIVKAGKNALEILPKLRVLGSYLWRHLKLCDSSNHVGCIATLGCENLRLVLQVVTALQELYERRPRTPHIGEDQGDLVDDARHGF